MKVDLVRYCVEDHMGESSTTAGGTRVSIVPSAAKYAAAHDAVLKASNFRAKLPLKGALPVVGLALLFLLS